MRIRVPGRITAVSAILYAFLCLLPVSTKVAVARPIGWEDVGPPSPDPRGDNDGVVLKSIPTGIPRPAGAAIITTPTGVRYASGLRLFASVTKLDYWLFWVR